jgi:hypothetical protein
MQHDRLIAMLTWIARGGYVLLGVGIALLSPLADLLPVEAEPFLRGDFFLSGPTHFYRVVSTSGTVVYVVPLALVALGVLLAGSAWLLRLWRSRR